MGIRIASFNMHNFSLEKKDLDRIARIILDDKIGIVSVYPQHFQSLDEDGVLELLEDSIAVLTNLSLYSQETGLSLQIKTGNVSRSYGKKLFFGKSCDIILVRSLEGRPFRKGRVLFYVS